MIAAARRHGAAAAAVRVADTLRAGGDGPLFGATVPRDGLWAMQTPQGARRVWLARAAANAGGLVATDEVGLLQHAGHPVWIVEGDARNVKLTRPSDWHLAQALWAEWERGGGVADRGRNVLRRPTHLGAQADDLPLSTRSPLRSSTMRIGHGYDVHRLVAGRPLILGGVTVPSEVGLDGHSDADVLTHAVIDALLGAAALGDIGALFPDTDAEWKGADSIDLLGAVVGRVAEAGWAVGNVDATVVLQRPKLRPHIDAMRERLAAGLRVGLGSGLGQGDDGGGDGVRRDRRGGGGPRGLPAWSRARVEAWVADFVAWLEALPPVGIYAVLLAVAYGENLVPPIWGDTVIVLCGSLVGLGVLSFWPTVALVVARRGALGFLTVFAVGRRLGDAIHDPARWRWIPRGAAPPRGGVAPALGLRRRRGQPVPGRGARGDRTAGRSLRPPVDPDGGLGHVQRRRLERAAGVGRRVARVGVGAGARLARQLRPRRDGPARDRPGRRRGPLAPGPTEELTAKRPDWARRSPRAG